MSKRLHSFYPNQGSLGRSERRSYFGTWLRKYGVDLVLLILGGTAVVLLSNPAIDLLYQSTLPMIGGALLLGVLIGSSIRAKQHIMMSQAVWSNHCPSCERSSLRRIHRKPLDRFIGRTGIPVRRYMCSACHWHGLRVDETRIH